MSWFGKSWGAPVCEDEDHIDTPEGQKCLYCEKPITADDQGIVMPVALVDKPAELIPVHIDCYLKKVVPHGFDCVRCRGRDRNQHKMDCPYSKDGGECCCYHSWSNKKNYNIS
jgi:hypothetical protein